MPQRVVHGVSSFSPWRNLFELPVNLKGKGNKGKGASSKGNTGKGNEGKRAFCALSLNLHHLELHSRTSLDFVYGRVTMSSSLSLSSSTACILCALAQSSSPRGTFMAHNGQFVIIFFFCSVSVHFVRSFSFLTIKIKHVHYGFLVELACDWKFI